MDKKIHLITEQDIQAYIDNQLSGERRQAVEQFLDERDIPLERARRYLRNNFDLKALKHHLYQDPKLKADIDRLLADHQKRQCAKSAS